MTTPAARIPKLRRTLPAIAAAIMLATVSSALTYAQTATEPLPSPLYTPTLTFDVVSIHESHPDFSKGVIVGGDNPPQASTLRLTNITAANLIQIAYHAGSYHQIQGAPDWANRTTFDISAKSDSSVDATLAKSTTEQATLEKQHMVEVMLADRFKLKVHWETRELPGYTLVVPKSGSKLRTATSDTPTAEQLQYFKNYPIAAIFQKGDGSRGYELVAHGATIANLIPFISGNFGATIVDKTDLTGKYDFNLQYNGAKPREEQEDPTKWPPLLNGLPDQLGLKLEPTKIPTPILIIDHIEKPSDN